MKLHIIPRRSLFFFAIIFLISLLVLPFLFFLKHYYAETVVKNCGLGCDATDLASGLFQISDMTYRGAFRVSDASYSGGALAYNKDHHSLYIAGHAQGSSVGEIAIPDLKKDVPVSQLSDAPVVSSFRELRPQRPYETINGMLYKDGQLIVHTEIWYDAGGSNVDTTLVLRDTENFEASRVDGYFQFEGSAHAAGYISPVPSAWQSRIGSAYIAGWSSVRSIVSRYSVGPSLFSFDVNDLLHVSEGPDKIDTVAHMNFPYSVQWIHPDGYNSDSPGSAPGLWNSLAKGVYGLIIPDTNTFAVFGSSGGISSGIGYKITQTDGTLCGGSCSYDSADNYNYYWLFDLDEIVAAEDPWDPQPYDYGMLSVPYDGNGLHRIVGATYDQEGRDLYFTLAGAGQVGRYDYVPAIVVYSFE